MYTSEMLYEDLNKVVDIPEHCTGFSIHADVAAAVVIEARFMIGGDKRVVFAQLSDLVRRKNFKRTFDKAVADIHKDMREAREQYWRKK